jgi:predicted DNA-binding transcriptional regulator AlpA
MPDVLPPAEADLIDTPALAARLNCSVRHVHRLRDLGLIPGVVRLGRLLRYDQRRISEWITAGCRPLRQDGRR